MPVTSSPSFSLTLLDSRGFAFFVVGLGFVLRVAALALVGTTPLDNEAPGYREMALALLHHGKFYPYWPPGVPYLLLLFHEMFGEGILVSRAANLVVYLFFSLVLFALVKEVFSRRAANLALLLFALYPSYIRYSFNPSTEYPAAACLLAIVFCGIRTVKESSWAMAALTGAFLGALALIRPSSLILIPLAVLYFCLRTKRIRIAVASLVLPVALISVWLAKVYTMTGQFVMINSSNWQNFFLGNNPYTPLFRTWPEGQEDVGFPSELSEWLKRIDTAPPADHDAIYRAAAFNYIASKPNLFIIRTFNRFCAFFGFPVHRGEPLRKGFHLRGGLALPLMVLGVTLIDVAFYWAVMITAIIVAFDARRFAVPAVLPVILGTVLFYSAPYWLSISQPRYNFPVVPLFGVLAAGGLESVVNGTARRAVQSSGWQRAGMISVVALFLCLQIEWILIIYLHFL